MSETQTLQLQIDALEKKVAELNAEASGQRAVNVQLLKNLQHQELAQEATDKRLAELEEGLEVTERHVIDDCQLLHSDAARITALEWATLYSWDTTPAEAPESVRGNAQSELIQRLKDNLADPRTSSFFVEAIASEIADVKIFTALIDSGRRWKIDTLGNLIHLTIFSGTTAEHEAELKEILEREPTTPEQPAEPTTPATSVPEFCKACDYAECNTNPGPGFSLCRMPGCAREHLIRPCSLHWPAQFIAERLDELSAEPKPEQKYTHADVMALVSAARAALDSYDNEYGEETVKGFPHWGLYKALKPFAQLRSDKGGES